MRNVIFGKRLKLCCWHVEPLPLNCLSMQKHPKKQAQVIDELRPGQSIELLKELHILTREGKLNQDTRRKLKQVYHLYQFIEPLLNQVLKTNAAFALADHGAGKSYLGFILYDLFFNVAHAGLSKGELVKAGHIYGIGKSSCPGGNY